MTKRNINTKIKNEFGIDLGEYHVDNVLEGVVDFITLPKTILFYVIKGLIIGFICYLTFFYILDNTFMSYLIYSIFGLILNIVFTLFAVLYTLVSKIKSDLINILNYAKQLINDIVKIPSIKSKLNKDNYKLLFKGVIVCILSPSIKRVISNKIPLVGTYLAYCITLPLSLVSNKIKHNDITQEHTLSPILTIFDNTGNNFVSNIVNIGLSSIQKTLCYIGLVILFMNILLIWLLI